MDELVTALTRNDTLAAQVTEQLERLIIDGQLQQGATLPSERVLADQFAVSRTVIREAVRSLTAKNLLEVKPGRGTHIRGPSKHDVTQSLVSFLRISQPDFDDHKIHEVRRVLETEIAGLASVRRTPEDLVSLEALVAEMPSLRSNREALALNDVAFHAALARATQNEMFSILLDSVSDIMFKVRQQGLRLEQAADSAIGYHTRLFEMVEAGNASGARDLMLEHLKVSEAIFLEALSKGKAEPRATDSVAWSATGPLKSGEDSSSYGRDSKAAETPKKGTKK